MIDIDFVNTLPDTTDYTLVDKTNYPILFLGFIVKNQYDNLRIQLNKDYNPCNIIHKVRNKENTGVCLKGIILKPNDTIKQLFASIKKQESLLMNVVIYENLLNQFNFACKETYGYFEPGLYPIDFNNLKSICEDDFNSDKKIFQHLLNLDEKVFDFQKFSSLKLFILTV